MWTYEIATGKLIDESMKVVGRGYSGYDNGDGRILPDEGKNDPAKTHIRGVGPIPPGHWHICPPFFHDSCGPYCLRLLPGQGTKTFGRSGFLIHGDSIRFPGTASHGCIILPRVLRMQIWESGDHELHVVTGVEEGTHDVPSV